MKVETLVTNEPQADSADEYEIVWPEPQTELAKELLPLLKALDASGIPKLSLEEIEAYLERPLGASDEASLEESSLRSKAVAPHA